MKNLILIAILIAGWKYASVAIRNIDAKLPQAVQEVSAQVDQVNGRITNSIGGANNPFATATPKAEAKPALSNAVTEICVPRDCKGMDCYKDLTTKIPVLTASN